MAQLGEGAFQPPPLEQEEVVAVEKKPVEIRISVFFDGTGNNRGNIQAREGLANSEGENYTGIYQTIKSQNADDSSTYSSFEAGYSNISILEEQYESTTECTIHKAFYIEGIATRDIKQVAQNYEDNLRRRAEFNQNRAPRHQNKGTVLVETDSAIGNGAAIGPTGLYLKIDKAYNEIMHWFRSKVLDSDLDGEKIDSNSHEVTKIVVDVFGFSRGAATARHFIHHLLNGTRNVITYVPQNVLNPFRPTQLSRVRVNKRTLKQGLESFGIIVRDDAVQIGFAGLFDTVSSYVVALTSDVELLYLDAVKKARKVYHLAAAEEHRACFSLTNIKSAKNAGIGEEYFLPGVHSDIGGGYRDLGEEEEKFDLMNDSKIAIAFYRVSRAAGLTLDYAGFMQLIADEGWYIPDTVGHWYPPQGDGNKPHDNIEMWLERDKDGGIIFDDVALKVIRTQISHTYRRIPLQLMAEAMEKEQFTFNSTLKDRYDVPASLSNIESRVRAYVATTGNSKPEDWFNVQDAELKALRHDHLHYSSRIDTGHWPRFKQNKRFRQAYDG